LPVPDLDARRLLLHVVFVLDLFAGGGGFGGGGGTMGAGAE
jgi:hypothetical protein